MVENTVQVLEEELAAKGLTHIKVEAVANIGKGTPEEMAERVATEQAHLFQGPVALVGQSAGGLVARAISRRPDINSHVVGVFTIASPHHGAPAAVRALSDMKRPTVLTRSLELIGYSMNEREQIFQSLTPEFMREFNRKYPIGGGTPLHSFVCKLPFQDRGLGLTWWRTDDPDHLVGDGFIPESSQTYGEVHGPFYCDHLDAMGLHFYLRKSRRLHARYEFKRIMQKIVHLISEMNPDSDKKDENQ
jgi:pimeloyl-ACP methyl ester carboxylesterase